MQWKPPDRYRYRPKSCPRLSETAVVELGSEDYLSVARHPDTLPDSVSTEWDFSFGPFQLGPERSGFSADTLLTEMAGKFYAVRRLG